MVVASTSRSWVGARPRENSAKVRSSGYGNKYLAWALVEAANFAIRHSPAIRRFYDRKKARTNRATAAVVCSRRLGGIEEDDGGFFSST
jgi:transposase